jgi:hypothetical protein
MPQDWGSAVPAPTIENLPSHIPVNIKVTVAADSADRLPKSPNLPKLTIGRSHFVNLPT